MSLTFYLTLVLFREVIHCNLRKILSIKYISTIILNTIKSECSGYALCSSYRTKFWAVFVYSCKWALYYILSIYLNYISWDMDKNAPLRKTIKQNFLNFPNTPRKIIMRPLTFIHFCELESCQLLLMTRI